MSYLCRMKQPKHISRQNQIYYGMRENRRLEFVNIVKSFVLLVIIAIGVPSLVALFLYLIR